MINIYKASAGSGKTYTLSKTYLELLLQAPSDSAFRNILAVTFTNKATEEMKDRILKDLKEESEKSDRAKRILNNLLHEYGSFSVSTIDKFFQQALRAFSREIGYSSTYQIELDKDSLINEAADRIVDEMTPKNKALLNWIINQYDTSLEDGEKPQIGDSIKEMGQFFCKLDEDKRALIKNANLPEIRKRCRHIIEDFYAKMKCAADKVNADVLNKTQATALSKFQKTYRITDDFDGPTTAFLDELLKKDTGEELYSLFKKDEHTYSDEYKRFNTAKIIENTVFTLGLEEDFFSKLEELEKEKNVLSLDESTTILQKIIGESDAPFIYEKLGVRYNHFLLDEFQDTSHVQWDNFRPLLENSVSSGNENIVVGDIKQSIYRFRDSSWDLLAKQVGEDFKGQTKETPLDDNWRSNTSIVEFNNAFFSYAAEKLGLGDIYSDVKQNIKKDKVPGLVTVSFYPAKEKTAKGELIKQTIDDAVKRGAKYSDITILVRANKEGGDIAQELIAEGYNVISDDSLQVKASSVVRALTSILYSMDNPEDTLNQYIAKSLEISLEWEYHSLTDLCDRILLTLKKQAPEDFDKQTPFIQSFMDYLLNWTSIYGNNLHQFLKHWSEKSDKVNVSSPDDPNAIRIMTIHKSKGLDSPIIIFPYSPKSFPLFKSQTIWANLDPEHSMGDEFNIPYPISVSLDKFDGRNYFSHCGEEEIYQQKVDNLNAFYVCLTRAKKEMHILTEVPSDAGLKRTPEQAKTFNELLYKFCGNSNYIKGQPYDFINDAKLEEEDKKNSDKEKVLEFPASYESFAMNPDEKKPRFVASGDAWDYFEEKGIGQSLRRQGIEMHALLSRIEHLSDVESVLQAEDPNVREFLSKRVLSHKEWFETSLNVLNETSVIDSYGNTHRPDRVIVGEDGSVQIIDFKFGEEKSTYASQVRRYMSLFRKMGYEKVEGYLWYIHPDKVEKVSTEDLL